MCKNHYCPVSRMNSTSSVSVSCHMPINLLMRAVGRFHIIQDFFRRMGMGDEKSDLYMNKRIRTGKGSTYLPGILYPSGGKNDFEGCPLSQYKKMFAASTYPDPYCLKAISLPVCAGSYLAEPTKKAVKGAVHHRRQSAL